MPREVLDVFLSSTGLDLTKYREAVHQELTQTGYFHCVWYEGFGPQDAGRLEICREKARNADIFVGLIGLRRGWEPDGDSQKRSITEMEYDWAGKAGRPRYLWVTPDDFPVPGDLRETDEQYRRQQEFRKRVMGDRVISREGFESPGSLAPKIALHLVVQKRTNDLKQRRPEGAPSTAIAAAVQRLAEDDDVDLRALIRNPPTPDLDELVAKLLARKNKLEDEEDRIRKKLDECKRDIGALVSLTYAGATPQISSLSARKFEKGDRIKLLHRPGRTAVVEKWYDPKEAKTAFPYGVMGAPKPPYRDGVVEVKFDDLDFNTGRAYPNEVAAGTSAEKVAGTSAEKVTP